MSRSGVRRASWSSSAPDGWRVHRPQPSNQPEVRRSDQRPGSQRASQPRSTLCAGDAVTVPVETPVVTHRRAVSVRARSKVSLPHQGVPTRGRQPKAKARTCGTGPRRFQERGRQSRSRPCASAKCSHWRLRLRNLRPHLPQPAVPTGDAVWCRRRAPRASGCGGRDWRSRRRRRRTEVTHEFCASGTSSTSPEVESRLRTPFEEAEKVPKARHE